MGGACALAAIGFLGWLGGPTLHGLPFAAFALGGVGLQQSGVGARRTALGRGIWSRAGGFERLLSTPSSEDRFDFAARKDLFIAFIPYAVAFGVADRWADKYRVATGQEPPIPGWYPYSTGAALRVVRRRRLGLRGVRRRLVHLDRLLRGLAGGVLRRRWGLRRGRLRRRRWRRRRRFVVTDS